MEQTKSRELEDKIGTQIIEAAFEVHKTLGPGLLEKVYEICLEHELTKRGLKVDRQLAVPIEYCDMVFSDALKLDLLVDDRVIVELKSAQDNHKLWEAQLLSYMRLSYKNLGYLINFNAPLLKQGIKRYRI